MPNTLAIAGIALIIFAGVAVIFVDARQTRAVRQEEFEEEAALR
jgi:hypothetical protein